MQPYLSFLESCDDVKVGQKNCMIRLSEKLQAAVQHLLAQEVALANEIQVSVDNCSHGCVMNGWRVFQDRLIDALLPHFDDDSARLSVSSEVRLPATKDLFSAFWHCKGQGKVSLEFFQLLLLISTDSVTRQHQLAEFQAFEAEVTSTLSRALDPSCCVTNNCVFESASRSEALVILSIYWHLKFQLCSSTQFLTSYLRACFFTKSSTPSAHSHSPMAISKCLLQAIAKYVHFDELFRLDIIDIISNDWKSYLSCPWYYSLLRLFGSYIPADIVRAHYAVYAIHVTPSESPTYLDRISLGHLREFLYSIGKLGNLLFCAPGEAGFQDSSSFGTSLTDVALFSFYVKEPENWQLFASKLPFLASVNVNTSQQILRLMAREPDIFKNFSWVPEFLQDNLDIKCNSSCFSPSVPEIIVKFLPHHSFDQFVVSLIANKSVSSLLSVSMILSLILGISCASIQQALLEFLDEYFFRSHCPKTQDTILCLLSKHLDNEHIIELLVDNGGSLLLNMLHVSFKASIDEHDYRISSSLQFLVSLFPTFLPKIKGSIAGELFLKIWPLVSSLPFHNDSVVRHNFYEFLVTWHGVIPSSLLMKLYESIAVSLNSEADIQVRSIIQQFLCLDSSRAIPSDFEGSNLYAPNEECWDLINQDLEDLIQEISLRPSSCQMMDCYS